MELPNSKAQFSADHFGSEFICSRPNALEEEDCIVYYKINRGNEFLQTRVAPQTIGYLCFPKNIFQDLKDIDHMKISLGGW